MFQLTLHLLLVCGIHVTYGKLVGLNESNWGQSLTGEWMIEFFAPWCGACRNLEPIWEQFSRQSDDLDIGIGHVDVTRNPALSGVFFITSLPTIYHVKNGEFRLYQGSRYLENLVEFVKMKRYLKVEPVPWYTSPGSLHMRLMGYVIRFSVLVGDIQSALVDRGLNPWVSYAILGLSVLLIGTVIGLVLVICCDAICPPRPQVMRLFKKQEVPTVESFEQGETEPDGLDDAPILASQSPVADSQDQEDTTPSTEPTEVDATEESCPTELRHRTAKGGDDVAS